MKYLAIYDPGGARLYRWFGSMFEAEQWLDSNNNNNEHITIIETYDETGRKVDGFVYTEKMI